MSYKKGKNITGLGKIITEQIKNISEKISIFYWIFRRMFFQFICIS